ncbi:hypothetical protein OIN60_17260 [Paenibacillus sp. P96]|uniref:Aspartyl-phosphate phosphatase Spo0E family protein n=1 Tax=Paenibacillus zeirhizosphaerae TaxID=2987519 RepID=A0ABT9FUV5_9BACL|nr:hypothetical protein [Paenibacillus sp. P96]MDP4098485.1 hypothetical protein [Paenibacillus sp. P96]
MNRGSEQEIKLSLLESIVLSQQAVARMMNSVSDIIPYSGMPAKSLEETLRLLTSYQEQITRMITGISLNRRLEGSPASPWMSSMQGLYVPVTDQHARKEGPNET